MLTGLNTFLERPHDLEQDFALRAREGGIIIHATGVWFGLLTADCEWEASFSNYLKDGFPRRIPKLAATTGL